MIVTKNNIYLIGGAGMHNGVMLMSSITNSQLGNWIEVSTPTNSVSGQTIVTKNKAYLFDGVSNKIWTAPLMVGEVK